jgi:iron complex transport system substrate-binding protein
MTHPQRSFPRLLGALVLAVALLLGAAACGSDGGASESSSTTEASSTGSAFPVTIEHKYGETVVEAKPGRVVSVGYQDQDPLLALGVVPVGIRDWFGDQPYAVWPWAQELLDGAEPEVLPAAEINFEQVAALQPDLIVGVSSGMTQTEYDRLSQIAPTIMQTADQPDYQETWQTQTRLIGAAVGESEKAEALIAEVEGRFEEEATAHPEFAGKEGTVSYVFEDGTIGAYAPGDARSRIITDLGFVIPQVVIDAAGDQFYSQFSLEEIDKLDHDLLLWISYEDAAVAAIKASPLRQQLEVVSEGGEIFMTEMEAGASSFSSVLSLPYLLDTLVPKLAVAVDGDPVTVVD